MIDYRKTTIRYCQIEDLTTVDLWVPWYLVDRATGRDTRFRGYVYLTSDYRFKYKIEIPGVPGGKWFEQAAPDVGFTGSVDALAILHVTLCDHINRLWAHMVDKPKREQLKLWS